jgi:hypothetical protein
MNLSILDSKLKVLIKVCKETNNYRKLAIVSYVLLNNVLNEIGIKLGIRPRDRSSNESLFKFMMLINLILEKNFKLKLFNENILRSIKTLEYEFLKRKGDLPRKAVIEMYNLYYDIRELDIPNLHEEWNQDLIQEDKDVRFYSFLTKSTKNNHKNNDDKFKQVILHKLKEKELHIQKELNNSYSRELFENAIYLKKMKQSLKNDDDSKIVLNGRLTDNIVYQRTLDNIIGYLHIGLFILFFLLGIIVVIEAIYFPKLTAPISVLFLITFGPSMLVLVLYWKNFQREGS